VKRKPLLLLPLLLGLAACASLKNSSTMKHPSQTAQKFSIERKQVLAADYLTGISMGGFGTWSLGLSHPERFVAIAPICGGGDFITPYLADKSELKRLAVWAFHGGKDPVVPPAESERMVNYLKQIGVNEVKLTVYPEAQHDSWTQTYANPELFEWFLKHSR
jgi:predicted peptidase